MNQIGLAVHNYEFHFETLPSGVMNPDGPIRSEATGLHISWIAQILPYLEERTLHQKLDMAEGAYAAANAPVRAALIATLQCPSDPTPFINSSESAARSSYAGCHHDSEAPIDQDNNGLLFLNSRVGYRDIFDGSTKTILISEAMTNSEGLGWISGTRATLRNTSLLAEASAYLYGPTQSDPSQLTANETTPLHVGGFGSYHPSGLNVAFADGSTRFLSQRTDREVLRKLGNRADGEIVPPF